MKKYIWVNVIIKDSLYKDGFYHFTIRGKKTKSMLQKVGWLTENMTDAVNSIDDSQFLKYSIDVMFEKNYGSAKDFFRGCNMSYHEDSKSLFISKKEIIAKMSLDDFDDTNHIAEFIRDAINEKANQ